MSLTRSGDVGAAAWLTVGEPWVRSVTLGPAGFEAYARLRYIPDPTYDGQSEADVDLPEDHPLESEQIRLVLQHLAGFTSTPEHCYLDVWEGSGLLAPQSGAFPLVPVPDRAGLLFTGTLDEIARWDDVLGDGVRPSFVWPADRAWCFTSDVDPHWAGIGGSEAAITASLTAAATDARLDIVPMDPQEQGIFYC